MSKYFEVKGETRKKILQVMKDRDAMHKENMKLVKEMGAKSYMQSNGFIEQISGFIFAKGKEPQDGGPLRKHYNRTTRTHEDWYVPCRTTKAGKALDRRMSKMEMPGQAEIGNILVMDVFSLPGYRIYGAGPRPRVIVATADKYKPHKKVAADLTRISDVDVEKLHDRYSKKKKRRRAR